MQQYSYTLEHDALDRSVSRLGDPAHFAPFISKLDAGRPVRIALLGASVGLDGGCVDQPGRRCQDLSGLQLTSMPWGLPKRRRFAGFLVRFFHMLNASWPHPEHRLNNSASDATPPHSALDCLFSHMPRSVDLVVLEWGSMARSVNAAPTEALLRLLLSLRPRPVLVFLTVREWCRSDVVLRGDGKGPMPPLFATGEATPWRSAESLFERWCDHYGTSCLSYHRALAPLVLANASGYGLSDVAADCLHPLKGKRGTEMVADILVHWLRLAVVAARRHGERRGGRGAHGGDGVLARAVVGAGGASSPPLPPPLPPPLGNARHVERHLASSRLSRCYSLLAHGTSAQLVYQRLHPAAWRTAHCPNASSPIAACSHLDKDTAPCDRRALLHPPPGWFYCYSSLRPDGMPGKKSPGLLALRPGARLDVTVDSRLGSDGATNASARVHVKLQHLVSHVGMGRASLRCHGGCRCRPQRIEGHRVSEGARNVSVYVYHEWDIRGAVSACELRLQVLRGTSSGGHKVKVRHLVLVDETTPENVGGGRGPSGGSRRRAVSHSGRFT